MSIASNTRLVNPRLGTYYGIFAAAVTALFFMLLIFEQLGVPSRALRLGMLAGPLVLFTLIGALSWTTEPLEFFASGRRVPAVFNGLLLAITAFGATGIVCLSGVLFFIGFDALCIVIGGVAGFVVMATALAPYIRKVGAFTIPSYLGSRLKSRTARLTAAALLSVPILLVLTAEIRLAAQATGWLTGRSTLITVPIVVLAILSAIAGGGMRSLTWSGVAQAILLLLALCVPVSIVGVFETNMPVPQLSHGPTLRQLGRDEIDQGIAMFFTAPLATEIPGAGLGAISKRFAAAFGNVGSLSFMLISLSVMAGVAAAPWMLPRIGTVPTVYDARKSIGWAAFFFGLLMMTIASVAVFMRDQLMELANTGKTVETSYWLRHLVELGWVQVPKNVSPIPFTSILVERDAVLFALPVARGMPAVLLHLALVGGIAAALAAASSSVAALAGIMAEDVVNGLTWEPPPNGQRLLIARACMAGVALFGGLVALIVPADPLHLLVWALVLSASASFPVLLLSVWWKRLNDWGAIVGMSVGFGVCVVMILGCEAGVLGVSSALAAVVALPAGLAAAMIGTRLAPNPSRDVLEITHDLRVPGGETIFDREMRLLRLRQRQRP